MNPNFVPVSANWRLSSTCSESRKNHAGISLTYLQVYIGDDDSSDGGIFIGAMSLSKREAIIGEVPRACRGQGKKAA
jgi:hypothetical protein